MWNTEIRERNSWRRDKFSRCSREYQAARRSALDISRSAFEMIFVSRKAAVANCLSAKKDVYLAVETSEQR
jgi:hypothetical protein